MSEKFATSVADAGAIADWRKVVAERIPVYGHRNWIAIVDSAYPLQVSPGIETILADSSQTEVLKIVLGELSKSTHVRPIIFLDSELHYVTDADAPGVSAYLSDVKSILAGHTITTLAHEDIIHNVDKAGQTFHVLIIKTTLTIPYTSVFLQLNCKYWSDDAENALRRCIAITTNAKALEQQKSA